MKFYEDGKNSINHKIEHSFFTLTSSVWVTTGLNL